MLLLLLCVHLHLGVDVVVNRGVHHGVYPLSMGPSHGVHPAYILASSGQLLTSRYQYHKKIHLVITPKLVSQTKGHSYPELYLTSDKNLS